MRVQTLSGLILSIVFLVVVGCGGGGGGGSTVVTVPPPAPGSAVLSGVATKGPISGGTVKVFEVISSSTSNPRANIPRISNDVLVQGTTLADGSYSVTLPPSGTKGGLLVQVTGGTYQDEATGAIRNLDDQFGVNGMRAIFGNISGAARRTGQLSGYVTPFTEMAAQSRSGLTDAEIDNSNRKIATSFGLPDIIKTKPLDPTKAFPAGASSSEKAYALALAGLSQYQKDFGGTKKLSEIETELETQIAGGALNPLTQSQIQSSSNNFAAGSSNPNPTLLTAADNSNAPVAMQVDPATASIDIAGQATILAQVTKADGSAVPNGTLVNFTTNFGTLSAASAPTTGGAVSVTLTSAAVGSATVSLKSGSAIGSAQITFFNGNAPVAMQVNPATASVAIGGPATILAQVTKTGGGAVPDGTVVNFGTNFGTLSAASALTVNGAVSVNLTSAAVGTATVSLASGSVTGSAQISFFNPNAPTNLTLASSAPQGITTGSPIVISATVTRQAGGPVPDGTPVTFSITSGNGALSGATSTVGGIATVSLSSGVAGTVAVSASAGAAGNSISVPFIVQPTQAVVKVRSTGTLPNATLIGGISATVTYAGGKGLSILPANVSATGGGQGSTLVPNTNTAAQVRLGLINVSGIPAGEFATLTFAISAGNFPTAADFAVSGANLSIIDTATQAIPGMGVNILSVTIQ
jgi:hypothetical protein